ncbi:MAG: 2-oxoglutarate and iron-dependent oxygenase domain-containing protein, partial [Gammaproteobacteria bacterium]
MSNAIPTLSLRAVESAGFVRELGAAYANHGFVIITDHGIPQPLIDRFLGMYKTFFAWPDADKRRYHIAG